MQAMSGTTRPPLAGSKFAMLPFFSSKGGSSSQRKPKLKRQTLRYMPFVLPEDREVL